VFYEGNSAIYDFDGGGGGDFGGGGGGDGYYDGGAAAYGYGGAGGYGSSLYDAADAKDRQGRAVLRSVYGQPIKTRGARTHFPPVRGAQPPPGGPVRAWPSPRRAESQADSYGRATSPRVLHAQGAYY
jgi:hypothetical protein